VGSLLRPASLLAARADFAAGRLGAQELARVEDAAIADAVRLQESAGLRSATDGEFRREQWHSDFIFALDGIERGQLTGPIIARTKDTEIAWRANVTMITGKVGLPDGAPIFGQHFSYLAGQVTTATPKITIPSPSMVHFRVDLTGSPYQSMEEFRSDVAAAYVAEMLALYRLGVRYLQLDDTIFAFLGDPAWRAAQQATGLDAEHQHEINVSVINAVLAHKPADMTVTIHMCRGNYQSAWFSSGGYDYVAEAVFGGLLADGLFLEYDDERSGGFEPLRYVRDGTNVVLGLVTTKTPALEDKDALIRRVEQAAKYVDIDRLCLSPQCGFASTVEGNALTIDEERAKLELVVETAAQIWGLPCPRGRDARRAIPGPWSSPGRGTSSPACATLTTSSGRQCREPTWSGRFPGPSGTGTWSSSTAAAGRPLTC
jgi:5-methyltetrahydropteroyltriglutamate--homocysteine methyltransferase